jgi:hypothetical protein
MTGRLLLVRRTRMFAGCRMPHPRDPIRNVDAKRPSNADGGGAYRFAS